MEAGRELDALIAERVMGLTVVRLLEPVSIDRREAPDGLYAADADLATEIEQHLGAGGYGYAALPHYSTDIAAAWQVVEKMRADGWHYELTAHLTEETHCAEFGRGYFDSYESYWSDQHQECGATPALGICLAALKAAGHTE